MSLIGYDKSWGQGQIDKSLLKSNSNQIDKLSALGDWIYKITENKIRSNIS